jgi:hypothetical protein
LDFKGGYPNYGLGFIIEVTQDSRDKNIVTKGFTKHGMWFRPPAPPSSSSSRGDSLDSNLGSPPSLMTWMTCMEPPKGPVDI